MPLLVKGLPFQLQHLPSRMQVEDGHVGLGLVLGVVHEAIDAHLEEVVGRLVAGRQLVVDDPPPGDAPIVEDVIQLARQVDRFAMLAHLESHIDAAAAVAEQLFDDLRGLHADGNGVGQDVRKFADVGGRP